MPIIPKPLPSQATLQFLFRYEPETGLLFWRNAPHRNRPQCVGTLAGFFDTGDGKGIQVGLLGEKRLAHRIIWKLVHDEEPLEVDHKDNNPQNNCLINLRAADRPKNAQNTLTMRTHKYLGTLKGCYKPRNRNFWVAQIKKDGVHHYLGTYKTEQEAHAVYVVKAKELFGEFANPGHR